MEVPEHRKWMDKRVAPDKRSVTDEFMAGVVEFVDFVCAHECYKREGKLRCPCKKCKCKKYHSIDDVKAHLCMKGFMSDYYYWTNHGEQRPLIPPMVSNNSYYGSSEARKDFNDYEQMAIFKWLEQDEDNIKKSFNSRGALALKNALFKVRSGEDKGDWIDEQNLAQMKVVWQEADWQQISTINKQNRQSQHGLNVHSGGSISAREHDKRLKVELNREPTHFELFKRLHRPKGKPDEWFNEKQAKIVEMYETQLSERQSHSGEGSSQQSTQQSDNNIYLEVVGGINKKGRILGLGSQAATIKAVSKASPSVSTDSVSSEEVAAMQAKIQELTAELQQKNLEQEMIKQKMEQWERRFERLMLDNNRGLCLTII